MTEKVVESLRYGTSWPSDLAAGHDSLSRVFLPSLALQAFDSPSVLPSLPSSVASDRLTQRALSYASLDYEEIYRAVLQTEAESAESLHSAADDGDDERFARWMEEEEDPPTLDEFCNFEEAVERDRVKIAVVVLRKLAAGFPSKRSSGSERQLRHEHSIWSNEACFTELICLLPIAVSRCPGLLTPEQLVKGLLGASSDCALLVATFVNNPIILEQGVLRLVEVLSSHPEVADALPQSVFGGSTASALRLPSGGHPTPNNVKDKLPALATSCPRVVELAVWALLRFCQVAPSFAFICRQALLSTCTCAEMALHITVDVIQDVLEFLCTVIFSREDTSKWMLFCIGTSQRASDHYSPISFPSLVDARITNFSDLGTMQANVVLRREGAVQRARDRLLADARSTLERDGWCGRLHSHLRLFCVLVRAGDLLPTHEEVVFWLKALAGNTCRAEEEILEERTLQLGISFVCLIPGLSNMTTKTLFYSCVSSLLYGVKMATSRVSTSSIELSVWLAVQLLVRNLSDIAVLVREALGMHLTVHTSMLRDLVDAATGAGILSEPALVADAVAALRPRGPISGRRKKPEVTLRCLEQMFQSNQFARYGVDPSGAILHCISVAREPIHPVLIQLVQSTAESFGPRGRSFQPNSQFLSQKLLVKAIPSMFVTGTEKCVRMPSKAFSMAAELRAKICSSRDQAEMAVASLATFYVLCTEHNMREYGVNFGTGNADISAIEETGKWWQSLLSSLPLRPLMAYMEERWLAYEHLLPRWVAVASALFPEILLVEDLLHELETSQNRSTEGIKVREDLKWRLATIEPASEKNFSELMSVDTAHSETTESTWPADNVECILGDVIGSPEYLTSRFENVCTEPLKVLHVLHSLMHPSKSSLERETEVQGGWKLEVLVVEKLAPRLLNPACPRCVQDMFCSWWESLPSYALELLVPTFLEAMKDGTVLPYLSDAANVPYDNAHLRGKGKTKTFTYSQFLQEPFTILTCSLRVYRTPLLAVVLRILQQLLIKNRRVCLAAGPEARTSQNGAAQNLASDVSLKREEVLAGLVAQDSAVCQILLEACISSKYLGDDVSPGPLLEARHLICATISSLLHTTPSLLKILHFQGYDVSLLPMMVDGVPSLVQCFDFLQELIQQPQQQQQIFAVNLTVSLVTRHPKLPQSLPAAQLAVAHCTNIRTKTTGSANFLRMVLGAVADCATTFPVLCPQVVSLLQSCAVLGGPLRQGGSPRDAELEASAINAFKSLVRKKILHGRVFQQ